MPEHGDEDQIYISHCTTIFYKSKASSMFWDLKRMQVFEKCFRCGSKWKVFYLLFGMALQRLF